jgi:hypothetical protein
VAASVGENRFGSVEEKYTQTQEQLFHHPSPDSTRKQWVLSKGRTVEPERSRLAAIR